MRVDLVVSLLVLMAAVTLANKSKPSEDEVVPHLADGRIPYDPQHPREGQPTIPPKDFINKNAYRGLNGFNQNGDKINRFSKGHMKPNDIANLKQEFMKIKNSDLSAEEKQSRFQSLRNFVNGNEMLQNMPPEVRARHQKFQTTIRAIHEDMSLTDEERNQRLSEEKASFKTDMAAMKEQFTQEELDMMREEQKKRFEGHAAAAMAAKQLGYPGKAKEYANRAKRAARGGERKRDGQKKRRSLSEPLF